MNVLYAFLDQQTGDTANRRLLEDALAENPGWKDAYLRTDDAKNASLQQNLDAVGDFFVTSRRAIDEQMDRNRREARVLAAEERRRQAAERIENQVRNLPEAQREAERQRLWQEFAEEQEILRQGAEYAEQQDQRRRQQKEEVEERQEQDRLRREEDERRQSEQRLREEREKQQQAEELRRREQRRQRQEAEMRLQQSEARRKNGPMALPKGYDYRDAAIHFARSLAQGKPEDNVLFRLSEKVRAKRQALEAEANTAAEVDKRMSWQFVYDTCRRFPDRLGSLQSYYGKKLEEKLAFKGGEREEQEAQLYADMKGAQLAARKLRSDLLGRFPHSNDLDAQLEPHRVPARREILEKRLGGDLDLRLRQVENEMAAEALLKKFFLHPQQKEDLRRVLENTFGPDLPNKLAAYPGEHPEQDLFREEVFEPALRRKACWRPGPAKATFSASPASSPGTAPAMKTPSARSRPCSTPFPPIPRRSAARRTR